MFRKSRENVDSIVDYPVNDMTIISLRNRFSKEADADSRNMMKLIIAVQDFRDSTAPTSQSKRKHISPKISVQILNSIAKSLDEYREKLMNNPQGSEVYEYCMKAVAERVDAMRTSNDVIYQHYVTHDNQLTNTLKRSANTSPSKK